MAHSANLLIKDVMVLWTSVVGRCETLERFFRGHYPRSVYLKKMQEVESQLKTNNALTPETQPTLLRQPVATRWASQLELIASVIRNEDTVEAALCSLRREKFRNDDWDLLGWVWVPHHWDELLPCVFL